MVYQLINILMNETNYTIKKRTTNRHDRIQWIQKNSLKNSFKTYTNGQRTHDISTFNKRNVKNRCHFSAWISNKILNTFKKYDTNTVSSRNNNLVNKYWN